MLFEADIKCKVLQFLRDENLIDRKSIVAPEFSIPKKPVRADLAVFAEKLIGIEIKGPRDSLTRLPEQIRAYRSFFDLTIVVVASRHYNDAQLLNLGCDMWELSSEGKLFTRKGNEDVLNSFKELNNNPNANLETISQFSEKYSLTSKEFWKAVRRRKIRSSDLRLLSRFSEQQERMKEEKQKRENFWLNWQANAQEFFKDAQSAQSSSLSYNPAGSS